jgi:hypothetical protein
MQRLSYWQQLLRIVDTSQGESGILKGGKKRLYLYLSIAHNPIFFLRHYSLFHKDTPCNPSSIPFILGSAIPMF